jgi:hypothetical protein
MFPSVTLLVMPCLYVWSTLSCQSMCHDYLSQFLVCQNLMSGTRTPAACGRSGWNCCGWFWDIVLGPNSIFFLFDNITNS